MATDSDGGDAEQQAAKLSVARGGPIYFPNMVGPLTRPPDFENQLLHELQHLEAELPLDSSQLSDVEDISVDELKVFTDEELVDMALKEAFKDKMENGSPEQQVKERSRRRRQENLRVSKNKPTCLESTGGCGDSSASLESSSATANASAKRKRKEDSDDSYLARVDELVKVKNKQDQDRATVTLHSFSWKMHERAAPSSERTERIKSLMCADSAKKLLKSSELHEHVAVRFPEVVLCVEVYDNIRREKKSQEFLVLGCQMLTEMREKIYCLTDKVMEKAGQHDPSGYFLVEDMFYNDLRSSDAIDYSKPIFDWLRNSKDDALKKWEYIVSGELKRKQKEVVGEVTVPPLPQFRRTEMHKTRFSDLRFRLGAGYLYCHQGDCKHTIVFRDLRLIHPEDVQNRAAYPIAIQVKSRVQKCSVCEIYKATKVTVDDKWAKFNPCYFCNGCYFVFHYSQDGSLLYGDHSVYDCT